MPYVKFTSHLRRFFPDLGEGDVAGRTVAEVVEALDEHYPGLAGYLVDERGALRRHVNIFVGNQLIRDREQLQDPVAADDKVFIFQALSGG
ncbi:MAG TPA: MoaD/ThiS family protein [Anaerolineae bacterium]|jgi:molybdopterin converting factor small subunit